MCVFVCVRAHVRERMCILLVDSTLKPDEFTRFLKIIILRCVCVCVCVCVGVVGGYVHICAPLLASDMRFPGAGVAEGCEPPAQVEY